MLKVLTGLRRHQSGRSEYQQYQEYQSPGLSPWKHKKTQQIITIMYLTIKWWNETKTQVSLKFTGIFGKTNGKYYVLKQSYLTKNAKRQ